MKIRGNNSEESFFIKLPGYRNPKHIRVLVETYLQVQ